MSANMDLSIIIVNWNTKDLLLGCLESLFRYPPTWEFEVIVIDNASTDGSALLVRQRFPQIKLILNQSNKGFAQATNQGLKKMRGKFALLLNPDTKVMEISIDKMIEFMEAKEDVGISGCKIINPDGSLEASAFPNPTLIDEIISGFRSIPFFKRYIDRYRIRYLSQSNGAMKVGWVTGACLMIRKKTIKEIGYLDEKIFLYGEDVDWCLRVQKRGWKVIYLPHICIFHFGGASMKKNVARKIYSFYFKRFYLTQKYRSGISLLLLKSISFLELLAKVIIINMKINVNEKEKQSRLEGYVKSFKLIFQKLD